MVSMAESFEVQCKQFAEILQRAPEEIAKLVAENLYERGLLRSPVDSGYFKANWKISAEGFDDSTVGPKVKGEHYPAPTVPELPPSVKYYISNNTPYAERADLLCKHLDAQVFRVRRGRESNPRIEVLQTSALPLGYPAECEPKQSFGIFGCQQRFASTIREPLLRLSSSANRWVLMPNCS
jgi:hypothetical protein